MRNFQKLLIRIAKTRSLFDHAWWARSSIPFARFFKGFARYCGENKLYVPFELFMISHPKCQQIDVSGCGFPMISLIWSVWSKRDFASANIFALQHLTACKSDNILELWEKSDFPSSSLVPLASFVWNKDATKFKPGSKEADALSLHLSKDYPLLATLVQGEIPHPHFEEAAVLPSGWRSPVYTSKRDLELHDLLSEHLPYDFSKVFGTFYGNSAGQPPFPHFDHPMLMSEKPKPIYIQYVLSFLPVTGFGVAEEDKASEAVLREVCVDCLRESFNDKAVRISCLTFVELVDQKEKRDSVKEFKACLAVFDRLHGNPESDKKLVKLLTSLFLHRDGASAKLIQKKLAPKETEDYLLCAWIGARCGVPSDYSPIAVLARESKTAALLLFIDRAKELGADFDSEKIISIIKTEMPDNPLKGHLLFHFTQNLESEFKADSDDSDAAIVVLRANSSKEKQPFIVLLQEALMRKQQLYAFVASSVENADLRLCAFVALLTLTDGFTFDPESPPAEQQMIRLFLQVVMRILLENKVGELIKAIELFSTTSVVYLTAKWYEACERFRFGDADKAAKDLECAVSNLDGVIEDDLIGKVYVSEICQVLFPLQDSLARYCASRSQIHLYRYLQTQCFCVASPLLKSRIELTKIVQNYEEVYSALSHCDLLGDSDKIVQCLVLHHSLALGRAAAASLGISSASAAQEWFRVQYAAASDRKSVV
jgi:spatacsin